MTDMSERDVVGRLMAASAEGLAGKTVLVSRGGRGFWLASVPPPSEPWRAGVLGVDNLSTGRIVNIVLLLDHPEFRFLRHDIVTPFDPGEPVHFIFNMASPASPPKIPDRPDRHLRDERDRVREPAEAGPAEGRGASCQAPSTSEVYGEPQVTPQGESYRGNVQTMGPRALLRRRASAPPRRCSNEFHHRRGVDIGWRASSTPTGRTWSPGTGAWWSKPDRACAVGDGPDYLRGRLAGPPVVLLFVPPRLRG